MQTVCLFLECRDAKWFKWHRVMSVKLYLPSIMTSLDGCPFSPGGPGSPRSPFSPGSPCSPDGRHYAKQLQDCIHKLNTLCPIVKTMNCSIDFLSWIMPSSVKEISEVKWENTGWEFSGSFSWSPKPQRWIILSENVRERRLIQPLQSSTVNQIWRQYGYMVQETERVGVLGFVSLCVCMTWSDCVWLGILVFLTPGYTQPFDCYIVPTVLH